MRTPQTKAARSTWQKIRLPVYLLIGVGIPVGLYCWDAQLEKTQPQRQAAFAAKRAAEQAEMDKLYPKCLETVKTEVTKADGSVSVQERQVSVYCDKTPPVPEQAKWVKPLLITLAVLLVLLSIFARTPLFIPW